ncbi:MAG TPA: DUF928 domain-containing protein [Leptolyngbyaceae cyanobacterium M33_DOE_097]|nr:DUF928 domain-containing protein [Leptolyngbyaceae cyanobacterium M33_DOE_097]
MKRFSNMIGISLLAVFFGGAIAEFPLLAQQGAAVAQASTPKTKSSKPRRSYNPPPKPKRSTGKYTSTGSRTVCPDTPLKLTAIVPHEIDPSNGAMLVWSQVAAKTPTLLIYVPYVAATAFPTRLVIEDEKLNRLKRVPLKLPAKPGLVRVTLPSDIQLEAGKAYRWSYEVQCGNALDDVYGWFQVVPAEAALTQKLEGATPVAQAEIYAQNGYWYDAVDILAKQRKINPADSNVKALWKTLLQDEELCEYMNQMLVE